MKLKLVGDAVTVGAGTTVKVTGTDVILPPVGVMEIMPMYVPGESPFGFTVTDTVAGVHNTPLLTHTEFPETLELESQAPPLATTLNGTVQPIPPTASVCVTVVLAPA